MPDQTWYTGSLLRLDTLKPIAQIVSGVDQATRPIIKGLDGLSKFVGALAQILRVANTPSITHELLNAAAGLIQSLLNDLLEGGLYTVLHHNLNEALTDLGLVNVAGGAAQHLPKVSTGLAGNPGSNSDLLEVDEGMGSISTESLLETFPGAPREQLRGFEDWLTDILSAFEDPGDPNRPRISTAGSIGGFLFVTGGAALSDLLPWVETLARTFELTELEELAAGFGSLTTENLANLARLRPAALFRIVQDTAFGGRSVSPDFRSAKLTNLIPGLGRIVVGMQGLEDVLSTFDAITNQGAELLTAIQQRLRQLSGMLTLLGELLHNLGSLLDLPSQTSILYLPVESGGIPNLQQRIRAATNRPDLGPGSLLVGGGLFCTSSTLLDLLASQLFAGTESPGSIFEDFLVQAGFRERSNVPSAPSVGSTNRQGETNTTARGVYNNSQDGTARGGTGRRTAYGSTDLPGTDPSGGPVGGPATAPNSRTLGSSIGGFTLRRSSWGTAKREILRSSISVVEGRAAVSDSGQDSYWVAHCAHDVPRISATPEVSSGLHVSGLLLEGSRENLFTDSDRFRQAIASTDVTATIRARGAPTVDLLEGREEAGPILEVATDLALDWKTTSPANPTGMTFTVSGCGSRLELTAGGPLETTIVGSYLVGLQTVTIDGRTFTSPFRVAIVSWSSPNAVVSPSVFVPPYAASFELTNVFQIPLDANFVRLRQSYSTPLNGPLTWSVFLRLLQLENAEYIGAVLELENDSDLSPRYAIQKGFAFTPLRTVDLPTDQLVNGRVVGPDDFGANTIPEGCYGLLEADHFAPNRYPFLAKNIVDDEEETSFDLVPVHDPLITWDLLDLTDATAHLYETPGSYQGFERVHLEVPLRHKENTDAVSGSTLELSSENIDSSTLQAVVVDTGSPVLVYDDALALPHSFKLLVGGGPGGRDRIQISADSVTDYSGKRIEVSYVIPWTPAALNIYPHLFQLPASSEVPDPPIGTAVQLFRSQVENGPLSSSIPTPNAATRVRQPEIVVLEGGSARIPREEFLLNLTYVPSFRYEQLLSAKMLLYVDDSFCLSLQPGYFVRFHIASQDFDSPSGVFDEEDKLRFSVAFTFGGSYTIQITRNGSSGPPTSITGPVPQIDQATRLGAKLYLGSRPDGTENCDGVILDFTLKDKLT